MSEYIRADKQIVVAIFGISTSLLTAIILGLIQVYTGYAIYSFTFWFVIPVGAGLAGFGAAIGYYAGAKLFHQKPTGGVLFNMLASSISAFFVVHYIPYYMLQIDGIRIKEAISFWQYLDITIRHTSLSSLRFRGSTGELGSFWGYAYTCLQLIGFSFGGIIVFMRLSQNPYCDKCSRYLIKKGQQDRFTSGGEQFVEQLNDFYSFLDNGEFSEAIRFHSEKMGVEYGPVYHLKSRIITRVCPVCGINHLDFIVSKRDGDNWKEINDTERRAFTENHLETVLSG